MRSADPVNIDDARRACRPHPTLALRHFFASACPGQLRGASTMGDSTDHMEKKLSIEKTRFDYGLRRQYLNGDGNLGAGRYKHPRSVNCKQRRRGNLRTPDSMVAHTVGTRSRRLRGCNPSTKCNHGFGLTPKSDHRSTR